ncbi:unnamed protein product, partial [Mesorhabditis spiculigera]
MLRRLSVRSQTPNQIFKRFIDFIHSSVWDIPISTFIEHKSLLFDVDHGDPAQHEAVHQEYAALVDVLIGCFCEDIGITGSQFAEALTAVEKETLNARTRAALEPVMAAQDLEIFIPMMRKKNVELQLQALQLIEFMCGLLPCVGSMEELEEIRKSHHLSREEMDHILLNAVLRRSKEEFDEEKQHQLQLDLEAIRRFSEAERNRLDEASTSQAKKPPKPEPAAQPEKKKITVGPVREPIVGKGAPPISEKLKDERGSMENAEEEEEAKGRTPADINADEEVVKARKVLAEKLKQEFAQK